MSMTYSPEIQGSVCSECGREFIDETLDKCPSDDCPSNDFDVISWIETSSVHAYPIVHFTGTEAECCSHLSKLRPEQRQRLRIVPTATAQSY